MNTNNIEVVLSQYYGNIYVRLYDTKLKKNVAKLEPSALIDYLNAKIKGGKFEIVSEGKGNTLTVIKFK